MGDLGSHGAPSSSLGVGVFWSWEQWRSIVAPSNCFFLPWSLREMNGVCSRESTLVGNSPRFSDIFTLLKGLGLISVILCSLAVVGILLLDFSDLRVDEFCSLISSSGSIPIPSLRVLEVIQSLSVP